MGVSTESEIIAVTHPGGPRGLEKTLAKEFAVFKQVCIAATISGSNPTPSNVRSRLICLRREREGERVCVY